MHDITNIRAVYQIASYSQLSGDIGDIGNILFGTLHISIYNITQILHVKMSELSFSYNTYPLL